MAQSKHIRKTVQLAVLTAILFIMGFTPLGSIPLPGPIVATLAAIPVVVGAVLMGTGAGVFLGAMFGFVSFLFFCTMGAGLPTAFVFNPFVSAGLAAGQPGRTLLYVAGSLIICFVPRTLIGLGAAKVYQWEMRRSGNVGRGVVLAGVCGSLINTLLVLGGIAVFFARPYEAANGNQVIWAILGTTILLNGIPEAIVTPLISLAVVKPLQKIQKRGSL